MDIVRFKLALIAGAAGALLVAMTDSDMVGWAVERDKARCMKFRRRRDRRAEGWWLDDEPSRFYPPTPPACHPAEH